MFKKIINLCLCLAIIVSLSGCVLLFGAAAGGAGTAFWLSGKLSSEMNASYDQTVGAAKKALGSLKMTLAKEVRSEKVTQLKSEYADGREVWIDVRPLSDKMTKVEVRVGARGDKEASSKIIKQIEKYL